jgi:TrmH family RNA methyltransferase
MLPLYKLEQLPRSQRLRKIGKIFGEAENQLAQESGNFAANEADSFSPVLRAYLADAIKVLIRDDAFSAAAAQALNAALAALLIENPEHLPVRRAINSVRHIILAETGRSPADWDFVDHDGRLQKEQRQPFAGMQVYLEDIRSPFNVGAMFRTAESFGVEKIWLSPLCADPHHPRAERTAMGCVDALDWERLPADPFLESKSIQNSDPGLAPNSALNPEFTKEPFFALETGGIPLAEFPFPKKGIMIVGSEELGVSPQALALADASLGRVSIPTFGAKGSLNVSVAFGIAMQAYAAAKRHHSI